MQGVLSQISFEINEDMIGKSTWLPTKYLMLKNDESCDSLPSDTIVWFDICIWMFRSMISIMLWIIFMICFYNMVLNYLAYNYDFG